MKLLSILSLPLLAATLVSPLVAATANAQAATAQDSTAVDVAVGYTYTHSNAPPSGCGCFNFNGGSASVAWHLDPHWTAVAELGIAQASNIDGTTISPREVTYLFGARYRVVPSSHRVVPFGELLIGGAAASNGYFPTGTASSSAANNFAFATGGGVDIGLSRHVAIRAVQADYLFTGFPNNVNHRQNNIRITSGLVFRFGGR